MMATKKVLKDIQIEAEKICNDKTAIVGTMSLGDVVRQGDLYVIAVENIPDNANSTNNKQLVPGTTQGSRHTLKGECYVFNIDSEEVIKEIQKVLKDVILFPQLIGPMFCCEQSVELDHPEHGNRILPAGNYATVYQRAFANEIRRVID